VAKHSLEEEDFEKKIATTMKSYKGEFVHPKAPKNALLNCENNCVKRLQDPGYQARLLNSAD
jgi:hypothetical protein